MTSEEVDREVGRNLVDQCKHLAANKASHKSDRRDLKKKELHEAKKDCQENMKASAEAISSKKNDLKTLNSSMQTILQNSQTEAATKALEMQAQLSNVQNEIQRLRTTKYNEIIASYKKAELETDSICAAKLVASVQAIKASTRERSRRGYRSITSQSSKGDRQIQVEEAKRVYDVCIYEQKNRIAAARIDSDKAFQDLQIELTNATQLQSQLQEQLRLASQQLSQQKQQKLTELTDQKAALEDEWKLAQQDAMQVQQLCEEQIADLTSELNSLNGMVQDDEVEDDMEQMLSQQLGLGGKSDKGIESKLAVFANITESEAEQIKKDFDELDETISAIEGAEANALSACSCGNGGTDPLCKSPRTPASSSTGGT